MEGKAYREGNGELTAETSRPIERVCCARVIVFCDSGGGSEVDSIQ